MKKTLLSMIFTLALVFALSWAQAQTPFGGTARTIPGVIEAEYFDDGGQDVGYHDQDDVNQGRGFRLDTGVDVNFNGTIGWYRDGEWLLYTVNIQEGTYDIAVWCGTEFDYYHGLAIYVDDELITLIDINYNGSWNPIENAVATGVALPGGDGVHLKFMNVGDDYDFDKVIFTRTDGPNLYDLSVDVVGNGSVSVTDSSCIGNTPVEITATADAGWVFDGWSGDGISDAEADTTTITVTMFSAKNITATFKSTTVSGQQPFGGTPWAIPGKIEVEDFDEGGEGVAYHDVEEANLGGAYRTDVGVDIQSGGIIGWFKDGEWMEYTVNVQAGTYNIHLGVGTPSDGTFLGIYLDEELIALEPINNTGDWNIVDQVIENVELPGGDNKILKLLNSGDDYDFDYVEFELLTSVSKHSTEVSIYPVPAKDALYIQNLAPMSRITAFDITGKKVLDKFSGSESIVKIDMSSLKSGIYVFKTSGEHSVKSFKVVKQ